MKKLWIFLLTLFLFTACGAPPAPAPENPENSEHTAAQSTTDHAPESSSKSTNPGLAWGSPDTDTVSVPDTKNTFRELYRGYEGNWYLDGYTDVSLTVSFDETGKMYIASWNYCFNKDVTYPLYAMTSGKESYMLEITEDNLEQQKSDYDLSFNGNSISVRGRYFYRTRKPRMTEADCKAFIQPYLGRWYLDGYADVTLDLSEGETSLRVMSENFSLRDRFHFNEHGAFVVYPRQTGVMGWTSGVSVIYDDWEKEVACHHIVFGTDELTVGGHTFVRAQGTKTGTDG